MKPRHIMVWEDAYGWSLNTSADDRHAGLQASAFWQGDRQQGVIQEILKPEIDDRTCKYVVVPGIDKPRIVHLRRAT